MTTISMALPLDDGFIRRECPACRRQFKWHHGPTDDRPPDTVDPPVYYCPYCGEPAAPDQWWTQHQIDLARALATPAVTNLIRDEFSKLERADRGISVKITAGSGTIPEPPVPLHEPHDMLIVLSPCHPYEPIKVAEDWSGALFCLVCGSPFVT